MVSIVHQIEVEGLIYHIAQYSACEHVTDKSKRVLVCEMSWKYLQNLSKCHCVATLDGHFFCHEKQEDYELDEVEDTDGQADLVVVY